MIGGKMFLRQHQRKKDGKEHSYWSLVETVRTVDGPRQRTLCYLGELNNSAHARWQKTVEVFNEQGELYATRPGVAGSEQTSSAPAGVERVSTTLDDGRDPFQ